MRRLLVLLALAACGTAQRSIEIGGINPATPDRVTKREWRMRFPEVKCEDQHHDPDLERGCNKGEARSCFLWFEKVAKNREASEPREKLRAICEKDRSVCGCGMYGEALQWDPAREREANVLLDDACVHGYADACDAVAIALELCVHEHSPGCDDLAEQGRLHVPMDDESMRAATLPAELRGCWIVGSVSPCDAVRCGFGAAPGTLVCFEADRISTRASPGAPWDQIAVTWDGYAGVGVFRPGGPGESRLHLVGSAAKYGRASLERAPESTAREARALPFVTDVCARAHQCEDAIARRLHPDVQRRPAPEDPLPRGVFDPPDTLLRCSQLESLLRAKFPGC